MNHTELLKLAEKCTPGEWIVGWNKITTIAARDGKRKIDGKQSYLTVADINMERDECHQNKFLMAAAVNYIRSHEFADLVEHARCFGEIGARMSADGGHRLAEIGPTALLAEISAKYYALVTDAKSWRDIQTYAPGETK